MRQVGLETSRMYAAKQQCGALLGGTLFFEAVPSLGRTLSESDDDLERGSRLSLHQLHPSHSFDFRCLDHLPVISSPLKMDITNGSIRSVLAETEQLPVDPSSPLHIHLDPTYKSLTPSNWAYTLLGAIRAGDLRLVKSELAAPSRGFTIDLLTEPLGPMRQTLLHVAALVNQGGILVELLRAADTYAHGHAEEQRLEVRKDALANKGGEANIVAYQTNLGFNLDKVERVST